MVPDARLSETVTLSLPDPGATERLGARLAALAGPGDVIGLSGTLGMGKTALARAFVTALFERFELEPEEIPSPTFTLVQLYEFPSFTVYHFDLYRLERPEDVYELAIEEAFTDGVSLIEWPEKIAALLPSDRLDVLLRQGREENARVAELAGRTEWVRRLSNAGQE